MAPVRPQAAVVPAPNMYYSTTARGVGSCAGSNSDFQVHATTVYRGAVGRTPEVGKRPAPSRHRSPTLSRAVRGKRRIADRFSRWSEIGLVERQFACTRSDVNLN
jgi:hypothetical protein